MSDFSKLKKLAEDYIALIDDPDEDLWAEARDMYADASDADTILALIAEVEKLRGPEETVVICEKGKPYTFMAKDPCRYSLCEVTYAEPVRALIAERDELKAENIQIDATNRRLSVYLDESARDKGALQAEVDSLTREADRQYTTIEAYRKNAERYEWLRSGASVILSKEVGFTAESGRKIYSTMPSQRELDSAIDAAISSPENPS